MFQKGQMEQVQLEKFTAVALTKISKELADELATAPDLNVSMATDVVCDDLTTIIKIHIWGQQLDEVDVKYPANWKEAFKEEYFPKSLLKRFPVKYTTKTIDVKVLYPKIALPDKEHIINVTRH